MISDILNTWVFWKTPKENCLIDRCYVSFIVHSVISISLLPDSYRHSFWTRDGWCGREEDAQVLSVRQHSRNCEQSGIRKQTRLHQCQHRDQKVSVLKYQCLININSAITICLRLRELRILHHVCCAQRSTGRTESIAKRYSRLRLTRYTENI